MAVEVLHEEKDHVFLWLGKDESGLEEGVQSNQYLIVDSGQGLLIDPGGFGVFSRVLVNLSHYIDPQSIRDIFLCHQDPDVGGSLGSWFEMTPATVHVSELWIRFLLHYGVSDIKRFKGIPDGGGSLTFPSGRKVDFVPAHFLHSSGNFHLFDHASGILFTGDIGAAVYPKGQTPTFVKNFEEHVRYMEGFHRRYIPTNQVVQSWLTRVRKLPVRLIAPQHGSIFREEAVGKFFEWIEGIRCGLETMNL
ncbi:MBL fold metallo-hydrolase [Leptospirillum ferriphilum]|uniref:MBL fold metallo-hydrolase n=1 Tax=Leptospirillum ferriphilum TaxID=178606 RepID=UPI000984CBA1|nr:MBL fold metallo-hydrolase [Leptospirillum ferriphilum]OOH82086.1 MBL fold metallo-hydrolase [Leptospirillum ferriphilum]